MPTKARIQAIGTAVPDTDVHEYFKNWAVSQLKTSREQAIFSRMAERSGIAHRWSVMDSAPGGASPIEKGGFYGCGAFPSTSSRMTAYAKHAPNLAMRAVSHLAEQTDIGGITHLVVASCTGFVAPGIDQILAARLNLSRSVERTLVGFMGCYAAVSALRLAHHIVRSKPDARVLVVTVELSTLHLQQVTEIEPLLAMLQFADGAAAALVTSSGAGLSIEQPFALALENSAELIQWTIGDNGFAMHLSGEVPRRISDALADEAVISALLPDGRAAADQRWAVHAGGRSILDAVETSLSLPVEALADSREVLRLNGNMSSSTLMFVLARMMQTPDERSGIAMAFGPGLAAEGFTFVDTL